MRDLVRESSRNLLEEFEDPSGLLERRTGKNSTVVSRLDFRRFSSPIPVLKELLKTVLGDL